MNAKVTKLINAKTGQLKEKELKRLKSNRGSSQ